MSMRRSVTMLAVFCALAAIGSASKIRQYASGSYVIYLDGRAVAFVPGASGGGVTASAIVDRSAARSNHPNKHPGPVTHEDITFAFGPGIDPALSTWISETMKKGQPIQKDGELVLVDATGKERSRTAWSSGFISEITFPELDASSKDAVQIQVSITPSSTKSSRASTGKVEPRAETTKAASRKTVASNFRLKIGDLDPRGVVRVESISMGLKSGPSQGRGGLREKTPVQVDVSNLVFVVNESHAEPIHKWHEDFLINGKNADEHEKEGTLEILTMDLRATVLELTLKGIGILKVGPEDSGPETQRRLRVEAYVESLELKM